MEPSESSFLNFSLETSILTSSLTSAENKTPSLSWPLCQVKVDMSILVLLPTLITWNVGSAPSFLPCWVVQESSPPFADKLVQRSRTTLGPAEHAKVLIEIMCHTPSDYGVSGDFGVFRLLFFKDSKPFFGDSFRRGSVLLVNHASRIFHGGKLKHHPEEVLWSGVYLGFSHSLDRQSGRGRGGSSWLRGGTRTEAEPPREPRAGGSAAQISAFVGGVVKGRHSGPKQGGDRDAEVEGGVVEVGGHRPTQRIAASSHASGCPASRASRATR